MEIIKKILPLLIIVALSYFGIRPLLHAEFFPIHDATQVARVFEMHKSLVDGLFPVRWVQDLGYGYGYPIFSFYAPFAYYIGASAMFVGMPALLATKFMIGLAVILSGISMYYFSRELMDKWGATLAAVLFIFAPYHALNLYVRGAVGELWAYAFIPLAFLGFLRIAKSPTWKSIALAAVGVGGIVISHNLTALIISPFILGEIIILFFKYPVVRVRKALILGFVFSLLVSSWYFLPAIVEMRYTNVLSQIGGGSDYKDHFVCLSQLWSSQWGYGGSTAGCLDGLSFQIGKIHILLASLGLIMGVVIKKDKRKGISSLLALGAIFSVICTLSLSKPLWDNLVFMKFIQFPWRFLQIALFFFSALGGFALTELLVLLPNTYKRFAFFSATTLGISLIIAIFYAKLFHAQFFYSPYEDQTKKMTSNWKISKISDEYLPPTFNKPFSEQDVPTKVFQEQEGVEVEIVKSSTREIALQTRSSNDTHLVLNLAYFPAWFITLDGKKASYGVGNGLYDVVVPKGSHLLKAEFIETPLEKLANTLSVIGIVVLIVGIIRKRLLFNL